MGDLMDAAALYDALVKLIDGADVTVVEAVGVLACVQHECLAANLPTGGDDDA